MAKLMVKPRKSATFQSEHKLKTQHLKGKFNFTSDQFLNNLA